VTLPSSRRTQQARLRRAVGLNTGAAHLQQEAEALNAEVGAAVKQRSAQRHGPARRELRELGQHDADVVGAADGEDLDHRLAAPPRLQPCDARMQAKPGSL